MKRPTLIWFTFFLFLTLGLSAMAWMTRTVLRLDQAQSRATAAAQLEENVRLALWRMDYTIAPMLSQEIARPYFEYSPVFPAERAYTRMYTELKSGDVLVPSPLLKSGSPYILLHFQIEPDGKVTSPQVPGGNVRKIAESRYTTAADITQAEKRLADVAKLVKTPDLLASLPQPRDPEIWQSNKIRVTANGSISNSLNNFNGRDNSAQPAQNQTPNRDNYNNYANAPAVSYEQQALVQQKRGQQEFAARQQTQVENNDLLMGNNTGNFVSPGVSFGVMTPLWAGDTLLLARRVSINGQTYVQGCLLDWPTIRKSLLDSAAELLPQADLVPVRDATDDTQPRRLASIPARLVFSPEIVSDSSFILHPSSLFSSPTGVTLIIAWLGVLLASAAVAILLRGVIALSQRRAGFVSAVTHELRTPLTTLRMYTEMLAGGMVSDPEKQAAYHKTLRAEANRLGHLVDNVLLYSRLERSNRDTRVETAPLANLLDRLTPRLTDRAAQANMILNIATAPDARDVQIKANLLSVEQILFNLVDNACKYAATAPNSNIDLSISRKSNQIEIRVADHGPGLDPLARARLFEPFSKSVHEAANSAPGLGLGLALSHRLAKNMSAELRLDSAAREGATFILTLPTA
jgi:signal transduction histidine kinase